MRSTSAGRRRRAAAARHGRVGQVARLIDRQAVGETDHLLIHVLEDPAGAHVDIATRPLETRFHPASLLAGFTAPLEWAMFGVRVHGTAHDLDGAGEATRVVTTYLLHRGGDDASILRRGSSVRTLTEPAVGTIPDLCRRVFGLPTPAPPAGAGLLWSVVWLDRILEAWGDPAARRGLAGSWERCARLHPALDPPTGLAPAPVDDVERVAGRCAEHAAAWSWARLRADPGVLALPDGAVPAEVAAWMDDGCFARWVLGAYPSPSRLAHDVCGLLDPDVARRVLALLDAVPW